MHRRSLLLLVLLWMAAPLWAQDIPPSLRDWQAWVLHDVPEHACPFLATEEPGDDSYQCVWTGRLQIEAGATGAHFSLGVHVDVASWVELPGGEHNWPQQVVAGGKPLTVLKRDSQPCVWLEPGDYTIQGELPWDERPASLYVPESIGLVALKLDGAAVSRIERNGDQLTLGEAAAAQRTADAISLRVYRRLTDGLPALLDTELQLDVAGSAREQLLGPVLPKGFVAASLEGRLPARLESDGRLRVQLRPGHWVLKLGARADAPLQQVALTLPAAPWPRQEIWGYADDSSLRSSRAEGQAVDADQANVPGDWHNLPAYALDDANGLRIVQGVRAGEGGKDDQLHLRRQLWLDFDGQGLSASDQLIGQLHRSQRLDVAAPWHLQRAELDEDPLLVTRGAGDDSGVELRGSEVQLHAGLRLPDHHGALPSNGWQTTLDGIDAVLHLPPGYRLLGAPGADHSPDSWVAQWSLLDLFVAALVALLAGRLLGWAWTLPALGFLILSQHEAGAPHWTLLLALALLLAWRALPVGRLRRLTQWIASAAMLLLVLWALPFASDQAKYALHPQLEPQVWSQPLQLSFYEPDQGGAMTGVAPLAVDKKVAQQARQAAEDAAGENRRDLPEPPPPPPPPEEMAAAPAPIAPPASLPSKMQADSYANKPARKLETVTVTGSNIQASDLVSSVVDSHSVVQAGPGQAHWQGGRYRLDWSGPVTPAQSMRLVIAPSWLVRLLRVAMLALLFVLLARLSRDAVLAWQERWRSRRPVAAPAALLALALLPALWMPASPAQAQATPDNDLLQLLHNRLLEAPKCSPDCAELPTATVQAKGDGIVLQLEVHAGAAVALPLPSADQALALTQVSVDGHADAPLVRREDGQPAVRLERGVHRVELHYLADGVDHASVHFALTPRRMVFEGQDWALSGVDEGRVLGDSVELSRARSGADGGAAETKQAFPPYVRLTRNLVLGLDWTVENTVERIAPKEGGFSIELPLLPGEHPQGDGLRVQNGRIGVTFTAQQNSVTWTSKLDQADKLQLTAPALGERAETWQVSAAPIWHVDAKGLPTIMGERNLSFQPLPGEQLQLSITRPQAVAGDSLAFDQVRLSSEVGEHASEVGIDLSARSTRGGDHAIGLPEGAVLLQASRDDANLDLAVQNGKLSLPLLPGEHRYHLRLRLPQGIAAGTRTPSLALGASGANLDLSLGLPKDRWILWTWGPTQGPAVLYWSQLGVLLVLAWLLGRYAPTPLRFHHWLLLGLGFSAFAWSAYAVVALWLILLGLRARLSNTEQSRRWVFNLMQVLLAVSSAIAVLTLVAAVPGGLLGRPEMHLAGSSDGGVLNWFADQTADALPQAGVFSLPVWIYKLAMLAWALWLANALIGWLRWGFAAWSSGGYWRRKPVAPSLPEVAAAPEGEAGG